MKLVQRDCISELMGSAMQSLLFVVILSQNNNNGKYYKEFY